MSALRRLWPGWLLLATSALAASSATQGPGAAAQIVDQIKLADQMKPADGGAAAQRVFALSLEDGDGHRRDMAQFRGKVLVVNFWATWCTPCVAEMPELDAIQQEFGARNVVIVGIGAEKPDRVHQFRDAHKLHNLTLLAGGYDALELAHALGDSQGVLPYTVVLSSAGRVVQTQSGALHPGQLRDWLRTTR